MANECDVRVDTGEWSNYLNDTVKVKCGTYRRGEVQLCPKHLAQAQKQYPQGWTGYPGDTCPHGVYVGGVGADYMCAECEAG